MASRYFSEFSEKKIRAGKGTADASKGTAGHGALKEKAYGWTKPGPLSNTWSRAWKAPVVKTRVVKAGLK